MATSFCRGWEIRYSQEKGKWLYADTGKPMDKKRPCKYCGRSPTPGDHDACLGMIPGVISACCGHGVINGFILYSENNFERLRKGKDTQNV